MTLKRPKLRGTDRAVRLAPARHGRDPHQRPRVARHRRLRPGPVGPRRRGHPGRGARARGDVSKSTVEPGLRGDQGRVRRLGETRTSRTSSSSTCSSTAATSSIHPGRQGRAGARRLGHHHRRQARALAPGARARRSRPTPGPASSPDLTGRGLRAAAARRLRRRAGA